MLIRTNKERKETEKDEAKTIAGNKINERHFLHEFEFLARKKRNGEYKKKCNKSKNVIHNCRL